MIPGYLVDLMSSQRSLKDGGRRDRLKDVMTEAEVGVTEGPRARNGAACRN